MPAVVNADPSIKGLILERIMDYLRKYPGKDFTLSDVQQGLGGCKKIMESVSATRLSMDPKEWEQIWRTVARQPGYHTRCGGANPVILYSRSIKMKVLNKESMGAMGVPSQKVAMEFLILFSRRDKIHKTVANRELAGKFGCETTGKGIIGYCGRVARASGIGSSRSGFYTVEDRPKLDGIISSGRLPKQRSKSVVSGRTEKPTKKPQEESSGKSFLNIGGFQVTPDEGAKVEVQGEMFVELEGEGTEMKVVARRVVITFISILVIFVIVLSVNTV